MLREPFKVTAPSCIAVGYLETNCQRRTPICAMNKFEISFQWWRRELLKPRMLFFSVANGAMNTPRHWELLKYCLPCIWNCAKSVLQTLGTAQKVSYRHWLGRHDACSDGTSANTLIFLQRD
jgi:hypothetical protein